MATKREMEFSRKRYALQDAILAAFTQVVEQHGLEIQSSGANLDRVIGQQLEGHTIVDQEMNLYVEVAKPGSSLFEMVFVSIRDMNWNPVITIWGRSTEEADSVVITGPIEEALPEIREKIAVYLRKATQA